MLPQHDGEAKPKRLHARASFLLKNSYILKTSQWVPKNWNPASSWPWVHSYPEFLPVQVQKGKMCQKGECGNVWVSYSQPTVQLALREETQGHKVSGCTAHLGLMCLGWGEGDPGPHLVGQKHKHQLPSRLDAKCSHGALQLVQLPRVLLC